MYCSMESRLISPSVHLWRYFLSLKHLIFMVSSNRLSFVLIVNSIIFNPNDNIQIVIAFFVVLNILCDFELLLALSFRPSCIEGEIL